jgi:DNA-binding CsgD family transcriptional regulator
LSPKLLERDQFLVSLNNLLHKAGQGSGQCVLISGEAGSAPLLDEARDLALQTGEVQRIAPVAAARAERAWLSDDLTTCLAEARVGFEQPNNRKNSFEFGQCASGCGKQADCLTRPMDYRNRTRHTLRAIGNAPHHCGRIIVAASLWPHLGCPHEQALALAEGDRTAQNEALKIFQALGAQAAADRLIRHLHAEGVHRIPRGPRTSTKSNPAGLTNRQLEVLLLMAEGFSNLEIAARLSTSPKTVEHHISSILAKLHARSRTQVIAAAHNLHNLGAILRSR